MGGKALLGMGAKKGVGAAVGRFGREALADAAILGGITQIPNAIGTGIGIAEGTLVDDRLDELSKSRTRDGEYRIGVMDRLKSTFDQATGGEGITQDTIAGRKQENLEYDMGKLFEAEGGQLTPGGTRGSYTKELRKLKQKNASDLLRSDPNFVDPNKRYETERQDKLTSQQQILDRDMADLAFKESQSKRQFDYDDRVLDYKMKQRKAERMQQIAMALGAMPGLFGI